MKELPINTRIRAKEVLLIGEDGEKMGILPFPKALQIAKEHNLDLVEVASTANPPVCRLMDYGKYKYEQAKKDREGKKGHKASLVREVRLRPRIDGHDLAAKNRLIERLLAGGDKVKVTVIFRGREVTRPELGKKVLAEVLKYLKDKAVVDQPLVIEERTLSLFFSPLKTVKKTPSEVSGAQDKDT